MKKMLCLLTAAFICISFCACGNTSFNFVQTVPASSEQEDTPVVYVLSDGSSETGEEKTFSSYGELEKYLSTAPVQALNLSNDSSPKSLYPAGAEKMASGNSTTSGNPSAVIKPAADESSAGSASSAQSGAVASDVASAAAQAAAAAAQAIQAAVQASSAAEEAAAAAAKVNALAASLGASVPAEVAVPATSAAANTSLPKVVVTKNPYGETVVPGGSTYFVSRASNATSIKWTLVNWDASVIYDAADASYYFPGVRVSGQGTDTLSFSNIPSSLNGWRVQAEFGGTGGPVWSDLAYLYVSPYTPNKNPVPCYPYNNWWNCYQYYIGCNIPEWAKAWTVNYGPWGQIASCSQNVLNPSIGFYPGYFGYSSPYNIGSAFPGWPSAPFFSAATDPNPTVIPAYSCSAWFG